MHGQIGSCCLAPATDCTPVTVIRPHIYNSPTLYFSLSTACPTPILPMLTITPTTMYASSKSVFPSCSLPFHYLMVHSFFQEPLLYHNSPSFLSLVHPSGACHHQVVTLVPSHADYYVRGHTYLTHPPVHIRCHLAISVRCQGQAKGSRV